MASDDIIPFDQSNNYDHQEEENQLQDSDLVPDADNQEAVRDNGETEEGEQVQDMDLGNDSEQEQGQVHSNSKEPKEVEPETPIAGADDDLRPGVRVVYNSLTRESTEKLMELMQQWSEWDAQFSSSSTVSSKEDLEYGDKRYYSALRVGSEKTSTVAYFMDKQTRNQDIKSILDDSVPVYDRGFTLGSALDDSERTLEAPRCFNCQSYSHPLKDCPKPRDNAVIANARKRHASRRNYAPGSQDQIRYYQKSQGKYVDLKPGALGPETRESLGIGVLDPPPWLHRMKELGYPPGYSEVVEYDDQPSGISIYGGEETKEREETKEKEDFEDGELPEKGDPSPPRKKMRVEFPGINAPIPENADPRQWDTSTSSRNRSFHHRHQRNDSSRRTEYGSGSGYQSTDLQRGHYTDRQRNDGPPGTEYSYSSRYGPYDHSTSLAASPNLGRSLSDRGWRSSPGYEGLLPVQSHHSPYPNPPGSQQVARNEPWSPSIKERQDQHHHQHKRHHRN